MQVRVSELDGAYLIHLGAGPHYRPVLKFYVHKSLVCNDGNMKYIEFPLKAEVKEEIKAIVPSDNRNVFVVEVEAGYRGGAKLQVLSPALKLYDYPLYQSEQGSLGVGVGALVETDRDYVVYYWERSGRLYGEPGKGITIITKDKELTFPYLDIRQFKENVALGLIDIGIDIDINELQDEEQQ